MKVPVPNNVDVLIVTALAEEYRIIRSRLKPICEVHSQKTELTYSISHVESETASLTIATTCIFGMGNSSAGVLAAEAIHELTPTYIIMFGLAGGVRNRVELGGVIVSTRIFYYELGKRRPDDIEERPDMLATDNTLSSRMQNYAVNISAPYSVEFGPFAVGEKVVADSIALGQFMKHVPKLVGIEMESYGVAMAAYHSSARPRFIAVRGVSDFADEQKDDSSREKCLINAADFLAGFLESGMLPAPSTALVPAHPVKPFIAIHHLSMERRASLSRVVGASLVDYRNYHIEELLIDQTDFFERGSVAAPQDAFERQKTLVRHLDELLRRYPDAEIGYFGLAHIPFIFHAGYEINRREVRTFATNRQTGEWCALVPGGVGGSKVHVEGLPISRSELQGDVVVRISVSAEVLVEQVQEIVPSPIASIHIAAEDPHLDSVVYEEQLNEYALAFRKVLTDIQRFLPNVQKILLFFAGPPPLAFRCGQQISKTSDPDVVVFNFSRKDRPNYRWGLNLYTGAILEMVSLI